MSKDKYDEEFTRIAWEYFQRSRHKNVVTKYSDFELLMTNLQPRFRHTFAKDHPIFNSEATINVLLEGAKSKYFSRLISDFFEEERMVRENEDIAYLLKYFDGWMERILRNTIKNKEGIQCKSWENKSINALKRQLNVYDLDVAGKKNREIAEIWYHGKFDDSTKRIVSRDISNAKKLIEELGNEIVKAVEAYDRWSAGSVFNGTPD